MATGWDAIVSEANALNKPDAFDIVRRRKIDAVQQITRRHLVIYAIDFNRPLKAQLGNFSSITLADKLGFDEVTRNLAPDSGVDVLLHSPGGSAEATESIVEMLRTRCEHIRYIVPGEAKSAATMMAMSGEQLVMDEQSELGPTDPQMIINRQGQIIQAPAQAIKDQFMMAQDEVTACLPACLAIE
ncbi:MAG: ATP-dependent Clp protease proteolytic subunit [Ktedonobacterales bacterium]